MNYNSKKNQVFYVIRLLWYIQSVISLNINWIAVRDEGAVEQNEAYE